MPFPSPRLTTVCYSGEKSEERGDKTEEREERSEERLEMRQNKRGERR